jgi:hypothetical protein
MFSAAGRWEETQFPAPPAFESAIQSDVPKFNGQAIFSGEFVGFSEFAWRVDLLVAPTNG